jgi:riboflavin kinase/FMN adenylyltransferase
MALGNFDGVHKGHQAVIGMAATLAGQTGRPLGVLTFDPHPARFFKPDLPPFALTTLDQKLALLERLGVDLAVVLPFDAALAALAPDAFAANILHERLGLSHAVAGYDFTFGKGRAGSTETLRSLGAQLGFGVTTVEPVGNGMPYSSTAIRQALSDGAPATAAAMLGRWWRIAGTVAHGDKRGRTIGFPTANIALGDYLRPRLGVYAVRMHVPGQPRPFDGVANLGSRPTVDGQETRLEVHLFDVALDLYGQVVEVELLEFIRPEQKFDGLPALKAQIAVDSASALKICRQPAYAASRFKPVRIGTGSTGKG